MITRNTLLSKAIVAILALYPQLVAADGFTSANVLEWSEDEQDNYFQISILMIGIVAAQMEQNKHIADCIDNWDAVGEDTNNARSDQVREAMGKLPEYHPQTVVLAVVNKECGKFQ